jgi:hypothetical protein
LFTNANPQGADPEPDTCAQFGESNLALNELSENSAAGEAVFYGVRAAAPLRRESHLEGLPWPGIEWRDGHFAVTPGNSTYFPDVGLCDCHQLVRVVRLHGPNTAQNQAPSLHESALVACLSRPQFTIWGA